MLFVRVCEYFRCFRIETSQAGGYELCQEKAEGLNCDEVGEGTIYYDNTMEAMRYDLFVGDGSGTSIYDGNFTMISNWVEWYCNVNDSSCTPAVVGMSGSTFIHSDTKDGNDSINDDS